MPQMRSHIFEYVVRRSDLSALQEYECMAQRCAFAIPLQGRWLLMFASAKRAGHLAAIPADKTTDVGSVPMTIGVRTKPNVRFWL